MKRDSGIAVLGPVATSAFLVLVVGMPRRGKGYRVKRHRALRGMGCHALGRVLGEAHPAPRWLGKPRRELDFLVKRHRHFDGLGMPRRGLG